ncbi:MAG: hypothetical protein ACREMD_00845 [Gemmatimonadota bacterium]
MSAAPGNYSSSLTVAVSHAAPGVPRWAVERAVRLELDAIAHDWGRVAFLAATARELVVVSNGSNGRRRGSRA